MLSKLNKIFFFTAYSTIAVALISLGVYLAIIKNQQTIVKRDIDKVEKATRSHENLFTQYQANLQNSNNRFLLKDKIASQNTGLIPIQQDDVISIPALSTPQIVQRK